MKRYIIALICTLGFAIGRADAMDYETARRQAYYLTDKMAYELNLNSAQYDDIYEINLDYFLQLRTAADIDAVCLMYRNEDIRYILHEWQWAAYHTIDYFYRPVCWLSGAWYFPVYRHYPHTHFYYSHPTIYWNYRGGHGHPHRGGHGSYYHDRRPQWNGGMRGNHRNTATPPGRGDNNRVDRNPGRGNGHTQPGTSTHRPDISRPNTGTGRPNTGTGRPNAGTGNRRGNDMRSSSRTTVSGGGRATRGGSTSASAPGRNGGASSRHGATRGASGSGSSRSGRR